MFAAVRAHGGSVEDAELAALISVDSTSMHAHQHVAGARAADHTDIPGRLVSSS